jgi:hypothetical protein
MALRYPGSMTRSSRSGVLALVVMFALLPGCDDLAPRPSDAQLIENFRAHRAQLDELMAMMKEDKVLRRVDDTWTDPENPSTIGISAGRIADYRRILSSIGYPRGFYYNPESGSVTFVAWAVGLSISGASKSVMFRPLDPKPLVEDLDTYQPPDGQGYALAYRHIEGDWYLEYDRS